MAGSYYLAILAKLYKIFTQVAKHLLSIKTTGLLSVLRAAKPLKNKLATKEQNSLAMHYTG
jgi:hypothetical protein